MFKFILGVVVGALVGLSVGSFHPSETRAHLQSGVNTITTSVSSGANSVGKMADKQFSQATK